MKKKILFLLPNLLVGGTQRVVVNIIGQLNTDKYEIVLVIINKTDRIYRGKNYEKVTLLHKIDLNKVRYINLGCNGIRNSILKIRSTLKTIKPQIVFSSLSYLNLYLAIFRFLLPREIIFIARESNTLSVKHRHLKTSVLLDKLYKHFYPNFHKIICQSNDMMDDLLDNYGISQDKMIRIPNPVNADEISALATLPYPYEKGVKHIVCIGHMSYQKGYDLLLEALNRLSIDRWKCHIIGRDAGERSLIEATIKSSPDLVEKVILHGFQPNPYKFLKAADLMVLSSRFEGFPNALLEAGIFGLPIVAFNNPGGIAEIVHSDALGYLAVPGNTEDLSKKIMKALDHNFNAKEIRQAFLDAYDTKKIIKEYETLFDSVLLEK